MINGCVSKIKEKHVKIRGLVNEKKEVYSKIQKQMKINAAAKRKMTYEQIVGYKMFSQSYYNELTTLNRKINELESALKLTELKKGVEYENLNFIKVYDGLVELDNKQNGVIKGLENVLEMGRKTLLFL